MKLALLVLVLALLFPFTSQADDHCVLVADSGWNLRAGRSFQRVRISVDSNTGYNGTANTRTFGGVYWTPGYAEAAAPLYYKLLKKSGPVFRSTNIAENTIITSLIPVGQTKPNPGVHPRCFETNTNVPDSVYYYSARVTHYQIWFAWNAEIGPDNSPGILRLFQWPGGPRDYSLEFYFYNYGRYVGGAEFTFDEIYTEVPAYMDLLTGDDDLYTSFGSLYTQVIR